MEDRYTFCEGTAAELPPREVGGWRLGGVVEQSCVCDKAEDVVHIISRFVRTANNQWRLFRFSGFLTMMCNTRN
jgi:hypothetical protein